jgi:hypothetical protein
MGLYIHYYNFHLPKIPSYTTTNKHKIVEYCIYLLVDCVQKWAYTFNTRITASQRSYPPITTNKHGSIQCYSTIILCLLVVVWRWDLWEAEVLVVDYVHSIYVSIYSTA